MGRVRVPNITLLSYVRRAIYKVCETNKNKHTQNGKVPKQKVTLSPQKYDPDIGEKKWVKEVALKKNTYQIYQRLNYFILFFSYLYYACVWVCAQESRGIGSPGVGLIGGVWQELGIEPRSSARAVSALNPQVTPLAHHFSFLKVRYHIAGIELAM